MTRRTALPQITDRKIVNGIMDVWQRGTSFTSTGYCADQWGINGFGTSGAGRVSRQAFSLGQTNVPGEPAYFLRWEQTATASTTPVLSHRVENVNTFAGIPAVWSFYANASATMSATLRIIQNFGTGGSPSSDVTVTESLVIAPGWRRVAVSKTLPSVAGKTLGSNSNDQISTSILLPANELFTFEIAALQIDPGIAPRPVVHPPISDTLADCWRYYWKSFPLETAPAQNAGVIGALTTVAANTGLFRFTSRLPTLMRATPTLTFYNPSAANAEARNVSDNTDTAPSLGGSTGAGFLDIGVSVLDATDANDVMRLHVTADASLP